MASQIIDEDGEWVVNQGTFPFVDPTTNHRFEPGQRTKVEVTDWILGQPVFKVEGRDEEKEQKPAAPAPAPTPAPAPAPTDKK